MMKVAFHVHTWRSHDSNARPEAIIEYCLKHGIHAVVITDHNRFAGAQEVEEASQGRVLVVKGEEIRTTDGEVMGLFMSKEIPAGLSLRETVSQVKEQGALLCVPHPGESLRREALAKEKVLSIIDQVDIMEAYNSRTLRSKDNAWALSIAHQYNKPVLAGSDAHFISDIARCLNYLQDFSTPQEFLKAVADSQFSQATKTKTSLSRHLASKIVKYRKKLGSSR